MAKRFQPLKEFGTSLKKPKLDVSIGKNRPAEAPSTSKAAYQKVSVPASQKDPLQSAAEFWDDEEDDALLLATQVAESEIAASKPDNDRVKPMEITESEITFSEFEPKIAQHSTQRVSQVDVFSQMLDDDDDHDFANLADAIEKDVIKVTPSCDREEIVFKKPTVPQTTRIKGVSSSKDEQPKPSTNQSDVIASTDMDTAARKQLAAERQIKFLQERLDALKEENSKLNKELNYTKEIVQTKTGEASMLRDELRHSKQKLDELKMEKMFQSETVNAECKSKIEELSKKVQHKESELQLKNMECSVLKMRQADESRRLDTTARPLATTASESVKEDDYSDTDSSMDMLEHHFFGVPVPIESRSTMLTKHVFDPSEFKTHSRKWNEVILKELENLQRILAQIQSNPDVMPPELPKQIVESVRTVLLEYHSYVQILDFGFKLSVLPQYEYSVLTDTSTRRPGCLHLNTPLYSGDNSINIRRYIAILSLICEKSSTVTYALLAEMHEEKPILNIAIDAINKLGYTVEVCANFGVLEAFAVLLRSIVVNLKFDEEENNMPNLELLTKLLREIVFARPNPWTLLELSYSILDMSFRFQSLFSLFCVNSPRDTFVLDRTKSVYRFSKDSCFLQVYCGLVESAFPLYSPLPDTIFELQTRLCINHVRFVFYCLTEQPDFVEIILSNDEEEEDSDKDNAEETSRQSETNKQSYETFSDEKPTTSKNVTATSTKESSVPNATSDTASKSAKGDVQCQCFEQLCLSAVRMVWLSLRQWLRIDKCFETEQVRTISRVAVHMLYFLFCDNYLACLFREDEDMTKHYIYLIVHWLLENEEEIEFSEIQMNLLKKVKNSHVIPKLFCEEEAKPENIAADLAEWCRLTNDDIDPTDIDTERALKNLRLEEDLANPDIFLELLKERTINMDAYDFS